MKTRGLPARITVKMPDGCVVHYLHRVCFYPSVGSWYERNLATSKQDQRALGKKNVRSLGIRSDNRADSGIREGRAGEKESSSTRWKQR